MNGTRCGAVAASEFNHVNKLTFVSGNLLPQNNFSVLFRFFILAARRKAELHLRRSEHGSRLGSRAVFTFVQPTEKKKITYREQQARLRRALARCPKLAAQVGYDFLQGILMEICSINI